MIRQDIRFKNTVLLIEVPAHFCSFLLRNVFLVCKMFSVGKSGWKFWWFTYNVLSTESVRLNQPVLYNVLSAPVKTKIRRGWQPTLYFKLCIYRFSCARRTLSCLLFHLRLHCRWDSFGFWIFFRQKTFSPRAQWFAATLSEWKLNFVHILVRCPEPEMKVVRLGILFPEFKASCATKSRRAPKVKDVVWKHIIFFCCQYGLSGTISQSYSCFARVVYSVRALEEQGWKKTPVTIKPFQHDNIYDVFLQ